MKPQQCHIASVYLIWVIYVLGLAGFAWKGNVVLALIWLVSIPAYEWLYIRSFPRFSRRLGYGSVEDLQAQISPHVNATVTFYSALGCPFCPLVERRLDALRAQMGFEVRKIDLTLRPELVASQGIRAVPVIEVGARRLVGNATSRQLVDLIVDGAVSPVNALHH